MKKLQNHKGFTLAELLIVVAIIAVLVAISIPIFTSQLEKSREATDLANVRAAYAKIMAAAVSEDKSEYYNEAKQSYLITVPLKQKKDDWQTEGTIEIAKVKKGDAGWIGSPKSDGSCTVSFTESADPQVVFNWGGNSITPGSRWQATTDPEGKKSIKYSGGDYEKDNYKVAAVKDQLLIKEGDNLSIALPEELQDNGYLYTMGYFITNPNPDKDGNYTVYKDSGEKQLGSNPSVFKITTPEKVGDQYGVSVQFFKKDPTTKRTQVLTQEEADQLMNALKY